MGKIDEIVKKGLDLGFFIDHSKEEEFSKKNNIKVERLSNGSKLLAVQREVADSRVSMVSFNMATGSFFDPKGKEGAHHFMEHLFFTDDLRKKYHKNLIEANAFTSQEKIVFYNRGTFNPKVPDFGLLNVVESTFKSIVMPSKLQDEEVFGYSKEIILREIDEFYADYQKFMFDELMKLILAEENPFHANALGTYESVKGTSSKDIKALLKERISSQNLMAAVFSEGEGDEYLTLSKEVGKLLKSFPREHQVTEVRWEDSSLTKPITPGREIEKSIPIPSNIASVNCVWILPVEYLSDEDTVFNLLGPFLSELFNIEGRNRGLGYSLSFYPRYFFPDKMMLCASTLTPKENLPTIKKRMQETLDATFSKPLVDKSLIEGLLHTEKARQKADPISSYGRLNISFESLKWFDHLFDSEKMREKYLLLTVDEIKKVIQKLKDTPPAIFTVGNFEK